MHASLLHADKGNTCILLLLFCRYVRAAASVLLVLGIITAAANVWCLGPINQQYIPKAVRQAEVVLERKASPSLPCLPRQGLLTAFYVMWQYDISLRTSPF